MPITPSNFPEMNLAEIFENALDSNDSSTLIATIEEASDDKLLDLPELLAGRCLNVYAPSKGLLSIDSETGCSARQALVKAKRYSVEIESRLVEFNERLSSVFFEKGRQAL